MVSQDNETRIIGYGAAAVGATLAYCGHTDQFNASQEVNTLLLVVGGYLTGQALYLAISPYINLKRHQRWMGEMMHQRFKIADTDDRLVDKLETKLKGICDIFWSQTLKGAKRCPK